MPIGVDEAGKGPVLGSMFAAAVRAAPADLPDGVGDSKAIPDARRERLADAIRERAEVAVAEVSVERIDDGNMNALTVAGHAEALAGVSRAGDRATLDAGDTDAARFGRRVADRADADLRVEAAHRADESDPLVGAASIVAKQAREDHVDALRERYGAVGSGYPSDPTTREFLREYVAEHGDVPPCARRSWSTCEDVLAAAEQSGLDDF